MTALVLLAGTWWCAQCGETGISDRAKHLRQVHNTTREANKNSRKPEYFLPNVTK